MILERANQWQALMFLLPFAPTIMGTIINVIILLITIVVVFKLNLCSYIPTDIPFEGVLCNRLLQGILIYIILKKIFGRK